jgi:aspartate dehydrogenase
MKIALIGCGAIGTEIAKAVDRGIVDGSLVIIYDKIESRSNSLASSLRKKPRIAKKFEDVINANVNLVVEAASQNAVREYAESILKSGKDMMILSVGALLDETFHSKISTLAKKENGKIYVPSGALIGIDGLKAARIGKLESVELTTRKNPKSLDLDVRQKKIVFNGNASDAVRLYPKNINVAATVGLATGKMKDVKVRIIADPKSRRNTHELRAKGSFGTFYLKVENMPSKTNPKTSMLAALSAIATLKKISEPVQIGA